MFSGKSDELISRLRGAAEDGQRVVAAKPAIEIEPRWLISLTGSRWPATPIVDPRELLEIDAEAVGIDEVQFLDISLVEVVQTLRQRGCRVIAAGLDLDFRAEAFATTDALAAVADSVDRLQATCARCGRVATRSQRLLAGTPAPRNSPVIHVGGAELYEPRCERCHEIG